MLSQNLVVVLLVIFMTLCLIFAIMVFTNEKFRNRVTGFLPFSNSSPDPDSKNKQTKGLQPGFVVAIVVIVFSVILAYYF